MANHFIAHWPDSHFRHHLLAALHPPGQTPLKLLNRHLTMNGERRTLADDGAVYDCLQRISGCALLIRYMAFHARRFAR